VLIFRAASAVPGEVRPGYCATLQLRMTRAGKIDAYFLPTRG
jgi:hypothetical protein